MKKYIKMCTFSVVLSHIIQDIFTQFLYMYWRDSVLQYDAIEIVTIFRVLERAWPRLALREKIFQVRRL